MGRTGARFAREKQVPRSARNDNFFSKLSKKGESKGKNKSKSKNKSKGKNKSKSKGKSKGKGKNNSRGPSLRSG